MLTILSEGLGASSVPERARRAAEGGRRCILLVPEQMTMHMESVMARLLPPDAPLYFEVTNFSRLANTVFRALGGISHPYADDASAALLMWKTLSELKESLHIPAENNTARVKEMLGAVNELYAAGLDETSLSEISEQMSPTRLLSEKLSDLSLILATYEGMRRETYGSQAEDLDRLAAMLRETPFFRDTVFFVDSFTSFTAQEYAILGELIRMTSVTVSLSLKMPSVATLAYRELEDTLSRLVGIARRMGAEVRREEGEESKLPASIRHAWENLFRTDKALPRITKEDGSVHLFHAPDPFTAADAIASDIARRVREGARYRDFVIFARDAKKYVGILDEALVRQSIPFFMSAPNDVYSFGAIRMILTAYAILNKGMRREDVIAYLKCGFVDVDEDDMDRFELYVDTWHIEGGLFLRKKPWTMNPRGYVRPSEETDALLTRINQTRDTLLSPLLHLRDAAQNGDTVRKHAEALFGFLTEVGCERTLKRLAQREERLHNAAEAEKLSRLFSVISSLLDKAVEVLGDTSVTRLQFADILDALFASVSVGQLPLTQDAVTVGSADMHRAHAPRFAYLIGACDGEFPATVRDVSIFTDAERSALRASEIHVGRDPSVCAAREQFCFLRALTSPSEVSSVYTFERDAAGGTLRPSEAFLRLKKMLPGAEKELSTLPYTPLAALHASDASDAEREALRAVLADEAVYERFFSAKEPITDPLCEISEALSKRIFGEETRLSQARFESYVGCPFAYYCEHVLHLTEEKDAAFEASGIGSLVHKIIETLFEGARDKGGIRAIKRESLPSLIHDICQGEIKEICPEEMRDSPRLIHLFERLERTTLLLAEELYEEFSVSRFSPACCELHFGRAGDPKPIVFDTDEGGRIVFHGYIDRVDTYRATDGTLYVRVIDYKTGTKEFSLSDIQKGKNLQMLLYLFSLWKSNDPSLVSRVGGKGNEPLMPAAMLYLLASPELIPLSAPKSAEQVRADAKEKLTRNGLVLEDAEIVEAMDPTLRGHFIPVKRKDNGDIDFQGSAASLAKMGELLDEMRTVVSSFGTKMRRGVAHATPNPEPIGKSGTVCAYCSFRPICRRRT